MDPILIENFETVQKKILKSSILLERVQILVDLIKIFYGFQPFSTDFNHKNRLIGPKPSLQILADNKLDRPFL